MIEIITSAKTAVNSKTLPSLFKLVDKHYTWISYSNNLDIGGGPYDLATKFLANKNVKNYVYDPYNRDYIHNSQAIKLNHYSCTMSNLLNVIESDHHMLDLLWLARCKASVTYITVYEGDKTTEPSIDHKKGTYQRNCPTWVYEDFTKKVFPYVIRKGKLIRCWG